MDRCAHCMGQTVGGKSSSITTYRDMFFQDQPGQSPELFAIEDVLYGTATPREKLRSTCAQMERS